MAEFGTAYYAGENINYGGTVPLDKVLRLLIDDGISSRGHRKNLLNTNYKISGIYTGDHSKYTTETVQIFAGRWTPHEPIDDTTDDTTDGTTNDTSNDTSNNTSNDTSNDSSNDNSQPAPEPYDF